MRQIRKSFITLSMLIVCMHVAGQNDSTDIWSDSVKLAEHIYMNIHYPLQEFVNGVEGTVVYRFEPDSTIMGSSQLSIVRSSGSALLDLEGKRLLYEIPVENGKYPAQELSVNFKLADNRIYKMSDVLEKMPEFPGGTESLMHFLDQNFNIPRELAEMGIEGRTFCGFIVEKDGSVNVIEILRSSHPLLDAEAMRTIKRMPKWTAGIKDGKPVRVYNIVPLAFRWSH